MDTLTIIIIAQAALDLVLLIVFLVMASNIAKIKTSVKDIGRATERPAPWNDPAYFDPVEEEISLGNNDRARELLGRLEFRYRRHLDRAAAQVPGKSGLYVVKDGKVTEKEFVAERMDRDIRALKDRLK